MRPRVICHMATSIDGCIVTDRWPDNAAVRREYEQIHNSYEADAWMCGRITMEPFAGAARLDATSQVSTLAGHATTTSHPAFTNHLPSRSIQVADLHGKKTTSMGRINGGSRPGYVRHRPDAPR